MTSPANVIICSTSFQSHFLQVSKATVILLEILPFLTQTQKDERESTDWFKFSHLQELLALLKQNVVSHLTNQESADISGKKLPSRFILTGTTLRAACVLKPRIKGDIFLVQKKSKGAVKKFQEFNKLEEKLMVHACPKTNSSVMNVSQFIDPDTDTIGNEDNEQISKYFKPAVDC